MWVSHCYPTFGLSLMFIFSLFYRWCLVPFAYLLVPHYNNTAVAYMMTFIINLMIGILTTTTTFILSVFSNNYVSMKPYCFIISCCINSTELAELFCVVDCQCRVHNTTHASKSHALLVFYTWSTACVIIIHIYELYICSCHTYTVNTHV